MINVAIIDDEEQYFSILKSYFLRYQNEIDPSITFNINYFSNADAFFFSYQKQFNLVLMDIDLNGDNGFLASKKLREIDEKVPIIFVTNLAQFAVKGYEVKAIDFIVKPVSFDDFYMKISRAVNIIKDDNNSKITLKSQRANYYVYTSDIIYVEIFIRKVIYHTVNGDYEVYQKLKDVEESLKDQGFIKVSKSTLINMARVNRLEKDTIFVENIPIQVSRSHKKLIEEKLSKCLK